MDCKRNLKKYSSLFLTITSITGLITTTVLAVKATPKALELIEIEKKNQNTNELTPIDTIKVAWKPYIPAITSGIITIGCIISNSYLNNKIQKSLVAAYAMLEKSYREYREKNIEMYNIDTDIDIKRKMVNSNFYKNIEVEDDKELFFDFQSMQHFESTLDDVRKAERIANQLLLSDGYISLNSFYDLLGVPRVDYGYNMGWYNYDVSKSTDVTIKLDYEKVVLDDGLECWIITMKNEPKLHLY